MTKEIDYKQLGIRIKQERIKKGITQELLAEMIDCSIEHISRIETNHAKVSLNSLFSISNALTTSIDQLLFSQYKGDSQSLDNQILDELKKHDNKTKEKYLQILKLLDKDVD